MTAVALLSASAPERPVSEKAGAMGAHWRARQAAEPADEKYCEGQGAQAESAVAPCVLEYVLAGLSVQVAARPTASE